MMASGNTGIEQDITHGSRRADPREKYFEPDEIAFNDSLIPVLEKHNMAHEAERLSECGRKYNAFKCTEQAHPDKKQIIFSYRCELRICPRCAKKHGVETRRKAQEILKRIDKTKTHKYTLLTLTERTKPDAPLTPERIRNFNKNVRKLLNMFYPKKQNCGSIAVTEVGKKNNIHAHVLVFGPYISQNVISKAWYSITGDSYVVDVRAAKDHKVALFYITKYIFKAPQFSDLRQYAEFLKAFRRVRRLHKFGIMYGVKIPKREVVTCPYCGSGLEYDGKVDEVFRDFFCDLQAVATKKETPLLTSLSSS